MINYFCICNGFGVAAVLPRLKRLKGRLQCSDRLLDSTTMLILCDNDSQGQRRPAGAARKWLFCPSPKAPSHARQKYRDDGRSKQRQMGRRPRISPFRFLRAVAESPVFMAMLSHRRLQAKRRVEEVYRLCGEHLAAGGAGWAHVVTRRSGP